MKKLLLLLLLIPALAFGQGYGQFPQASGGAGNPAGSNTQLQYNNGGVFGGTSGATTSGSTVTLTSPKVVTSLLDTNANTLLGITATASAVNDLNLANS